MARRVGTIAVLIASMLVIVACASTPVAAPAPVKETVVVKETVSVPVVVTPTSAAAALVKKSGPVFIGSTGGMTAKHFNPIWLTSNPQFLTFPLILPALTWFNDKVQPVPDLASKIDVNADATVYTFTLPKEAKWSDGVALTTKDVAYTYKLALDPAITTGTSWPTNFSSIKGATDYQKGTVKDVEGIKIVDDQTIRFELKEPNAAFLFSTYLGILPEHVLSKIDPKDMEKQAYMDAPTITSGPYDFVKYEPGQYIQLKKKADYWGKKVQVDEVYIKIFEQTATMLAQLEAGELQIGTVPADELARFKALQHINVVSVKGVGYYVTHFDFRTKETIAQQNKPKDQGGLGYANNREVKVYMQDKRFRQALAYAVDRNAVIQVVAGGEATPIYSSMFGPDWAINPKLNTYDVDLDKSKALMKQVGVTFDDKNTALWQGKQIILTYLSDTSEEARKLGEVLQQQFGKIGIRLDIKLLTSAAFLQAAYNGEGDLIRNAGGRFGSDPSVSTLYYTCKAGWASSVIGYCNPKFDELMAKGVTSSKTEDRQKIYYEASAILNDELPSLFLMSKNVFYAANKGLTGAKPSADPSYLTWNIEDWAFSK